MPEEQGREESNLGGAGFGDRPVTMTSALRSDARAVRARCMSSPFTRLPVALLRAWDYQRRDIWGRPASSSFLLVSGQMPVPTHARELDRAWPRSSASAV